MVTESRTLHIPLARPVGQAERLEAVRCALSFRAFLRHWHFTNRETGEVMAFGPCDCGHRPSLWDGQRALAAAMEDAPWLFALKAGKLGFSELACAYDGWVARFGPPNARVHMFSYSGDSAAEIFSWVRFGLEHLPAWMRLPLVEGEMGADTGHSLKLYAGPNDVRRVVAYKSKPNISIDQTATHCVHGDSRVLLPTKGGHGKPQSARIRNLVRDRYDGDVLTLDPATRQLVARRVIGWHQNAIGSRRMVRLRLKHGAMHKHGAREVKLTEDHPVLTVDGWLPAGQLRSGTLVATGENAPNERQAQMLTGAMLGDGYVTVTSRRFSTTHADCEYGELIGRGMRGLSPVLSDAMGSTGRPQRKVVAQGTWAGRLRERWYRGDRRRCLDKQAIESMGDLGLAVWFLDDGWLYKKGLGRDVGGFATNRYVKDDVEWLSEYLNSLGVKNHLKAARHGQWSLYVYADGVEVLMRRIGAYIPPCMERKRTADTPPFDASLWDLGEAVCGFDEIVVESWTPPAHERSVYCIDVEETHNFVTFGGVVHNCHLDEFTRWPYGERTWNSVQSTIAPDGSCHIITRGNGPGWSARVYEKAKAGLIQSQSRKHTMRAFFAPFWMRPGRGVTPAEHAAWKDAEAAGYDELGLKQWAPETEREALQGGGSYVFPQWENPPGRHVVKAHPWRLRDSQRVGVGIDPGGGNPTAMGLWGENSAGRYHLFAEFYAPNVGADDILDQLGSWYALAEAEQFRVWVPADNEVLLRTIEAAGYDVHFADKHKADGIQLLTMRLNTNGITVHDSCAGLIAEVPDYRWQRQADAETKVVYTGDRPIKHHADSVDQARYAMMGFAQWEYEAPNQGVVLRGGRRAG